MADNRVKWLLAVAAVLAAARLVVVPWAQTQTEQRQQLEVLTKRLDRSEGVVRNSEAIFAARETLRKDTGAALAIFPEAPGDDDSRLAAQRRITALAAQSGLTVTLFDWQLDGDIEEAGLAFSRASIKLDGPLDRIILFHGEFEARLPFAAMREFQLRSRSAVSGPTDDLASATLVVDLFYRPAANSDEPGGESS